MIARRALLAGLPAAAAAIGIPAAVATAVASDFARPAGDRLRHHVDELASAVSAIDPKVTAWALQRSKGRFILIGTSDMEISFGVGVGGFLSIDKFVHGQRGAVPLAPEPPYKWNRTPDERRLMDISRETFYRCWLGMEG
jgi:hypothetical protein